MSEFPPPDNDKPSRLKSARRAIGNAYNRFRNWSHNVNQAGEDADRAIAREVRSGSHRMLEGARDTSAYLDEKGRAAGQAIGRAAKRSARAVGRKIQPHIDRLPAAGFGVRKQNHKGEAKRMIEEAAGVTMTEAQANRLLDRALGSGRPGTGSARALIEAVDARIAEFEAELIGEENAYLLQREKTEPGGMIRNLRDRRRDRLENSTDDGVSDWERRAQNLDLALQIVLVGQTRAQWRSPEDGKRWREAEKRKHFPAASSERAENTSRAQEEGRRRDGARETETGEGKEALELLREIEAMLRRISRGEPAEGATREELERLRGEAATYEELRERAEGAEQAHKEQLEKLRALREKLEAVVEAQARVDEKMRELEEAKKGGGEEEVEKRARLQALGGTRDNPGLIGQMREKKSREPRNPDLVPALGNLEREKEEIEAWLKEKGAPDEGKLTRLEALVRASEEEYEQRLDSFSELLDAVVENTQEAQERVSIVEQSVNEAGVMARQAKARAEAALALVMEHSKRLGVTEEEENVEEGGPPPRLSEGGEDGGGEEDNGQEQERRIEFNRRVGLLKNALSVLMTPGSEESGAYARGTVRRRIAELAQVLKTTETEAGADGMVERTMEREDIFTVAHAALLAIEERATEEGTPGSPLIPSNEFVERMLSRQESADRAENYLLEILSASCSFSAEDARRGNDEGKDARMRIAEALKEELGQVVRF